MFVGKIDAVLVDRTRAHVTDAMAPLLAAVSKPVSTVAAKVEEFTRLADIREENKRLRERGGEDAADFPKAMVVDESLRKILKK